MDFIIHNKSINLVSNEYMFILAETILYSVIVELFNCGKDWNNDEI